MKFCDSTFTDTMYCIHMYNNYHYVSLTERKGHATIRLQPPHMLHQLTLPIWYMGGVTEIIVACISETTGMKTVTDLQVWLPSSH